MCVTKARYTVAAMLIGCFVANSQAAVTPPSMTDLSVGEWQLNVAQSNFGCSKAPLTSRAHIFDAGWDLTVAEWTGRQADGKPITTRQVWRYDGETYPISMTKAGAQEGMTYKLSNPHHVDFEYVDQSGKVISTHTRDVSADDQTMTQVSKFVGKTCQDVEVFERR